MKAKKNSKGYMLIEIILASVIAFGVAVFLISLTLKLKNKNDDTFVNTLTVTDTAIVTNKLMDYAIRDKGNFACNELVVDDEDHKTLRYKGDVVNVFNDYVDASKIHCSTTDGTVSIVIRPKVEQMPGEDFDIKVDYKYRIDDVSYPVLKVVADRGTIWKQNGKATITISDSNGLANGEYKIKYGWGTNRLACDKMIYDVTIGIANNAKEGTKTIDIDAEHGAGSGKGKIYVCNVDEIKDVNGNVLPSSVSSDDMYLDNTKPVCALTIKEVEKHKKVVFSKKIDYDSGIDAYDIIDININANVATYDKDTADLYQVAYGCGHQYRGHIRDNAGNESVCKLYYECDPAPPDPDPEYPQIGQETTTSNDDNGGDDGCFLKGTKIMTINGLIDINKVKIGDLVLTYNEGTGNNEYHKVNYLFTYSPDEINENLYTISFDDLTDLQVSSSHKFYIKRDDKYLWLSTKEIKVGDVVTYSNKEVHRIINLKHEKLSERVYNLSVDNTHNYYVGMQQILVHNMMVCGENPLDGVSHLPDGTPYTGLDGCK